MSQTSGSKESSMSLLFLGLRDRGKWGKVGILPGDIALIANAFVKNRPQKNRGINIDVFVSRSDSFHELAISKDLVKVGEKFWIAETRNVSGSEYNTGEFCDAFSWLQRGFPSRLQ